MLGQLVGLRQSSLRRRVGDNLPVTGSRFEENGTRWRRRARIGLEELTAAAAAIGTRRADIERRARRLLI